MKSRIGRTAAIGWALAVATAGAACALGVSDEEARRVELIAKLERSVVVVLAEGREISHEGKVLTLRSAEGLGTGVVLSANGLVLTAAHVVANADRIRIKFEGVEPVAARIVFSDEAADVALLRLEKIPAPLFPARLGNSDSVRRGETVYVIGNPVGIERSLSVGVVSGKHPLKHVYGGSVEAEVVQTDAAINKGNSGGPIFNSRGEVIAIAQSILSEGGGFEGLGFGLAINAVKKVLGLDPCIWLGFSGVALDPEWSAALNAPEKGALLVEEVTPGGPADKAGLRRGAIPIQSGAEYFLLGGDVILKIDGRPPLEWVRTPHPTRPGERHEVRLTVLRGGQARELPLVTVHREGW